MTPMLQMVALIILSSTIGAILTVVYVKLISSLGVWIKKRYGNAIKQWCRHHKLPIFKHCNYSSNHSGKQRQNCD